MDSARFTHIGLEILPERALLAGLHLDSFVEHALAKDFVTAVAWHDDNDLEQLKRVLQGGN